MSVKMSASGIPWEECLRLSKEYSDNVIANERQRRASNNKAAIEKGKKKNEKSELHKIWLKNRNYRIYFARKFGDSFRKIANIHGITAETVRQICLKERKLEIKRDRKIIRGSVIDLGGQDGIWHTWTPETNAIELGMIDK